MDKLRVLFLCTGNSARSQMAEALLKKLGGERFEVFSAGLDPKGIHPMTVKVMGEEGIDIKDYRSKSLDEFLGKMHFSYVITVCGHADKNCPSVFPGALNRLHWEFKDPAAFIGSDEEKLFEFRQIKDQIKSRIMEWLEQL